MARNLCLFAACALAFFVCSPIRSQDSPSLGDVARRAQKDKDKANKPPAKVITNDDMPSKAGGSTTASGAAAPEGGAQPPASGDSSAIQSPDQGLKKLQSDLDHLDSLDRAGLAFEVLEGNADNFPGRARWEERLFAAKQTFVGQTRAVLQEARQITAAAAGIQDADNPNDPRVKTLSTKLQDLVQETQQNGAAFQSIVAEGRRLAGLPAAQ